METGERVVDDISNDVEQDLEDAKDEEDKPVISYPLEVTYCGHCGLPPEV